jgi:predicted RNase H-like HicB family nuclease
MTNPLYRRQGTAFSISTSHAACLVSSFPTCPAAVASGEDFVQARDHAKRALDLWIDDSRDRGEAVPAPTAPGEPQRLAAVTVWISSRSGFDQERCRPHGGQSVRMT